MARNTGGGERKAAATGRTPVRRDDGDWQKRDERTGRFMERQQRDAPLRGFAEGPDVSGPRAAATVAAVSSAGHLAITRLKKAGGSLVMTVPAAARNLLRLTEGQEMIVSVDGGKVIVEPMPAPTPAVHARRPKYTLEELLADADPQAALSGEERAWHDAPPAGRENW